MFSKKERKRIWVCCDILVGYCMLVPDLCSVTTWDDETALLCIVLLAVCLELGSFGCLPGTLGLYGCLPETRPLFGCFPEDTDGFGCFPTLIA